MKVVALLCLAGLAAAGYYDGHQTFVVVPKDETQVKAVLTMEDHGFFVNFFEHSDYPGKQNVFIVKPNDIDDIKQYLGSFGMEVKVVHENVQKIVDAEDALNAMLAKAHPYIPGVRQSYDFAQYNRFETIENFLASLHEDFPAFTDIINIGESFEGRPLNLFKIGQPSENPKPGFYVECNTHAREFITAGSCVFMINMIIEEFNNGNPDFQPYVNDMDWYFLSVANPDGYEYAHTRSRYWRKTRSGPHSGRYGVDPNRNWDSRWGGVGSSSSPGSDTYRGPEAFSEPETRLQADFIMEHRDTIKAFIAVHSFTQLWLIPYSYARNTQPPDGAELNQIADDVVDAIRATHGQTYRPGTSANILYAVTGGSHDWAKENANIKWSYTPECRPRFAFGPAGFNPNPNQIIPNAEEVFNGFRVVADRILADAKAGM